MWFGLVRFYGILIIVGYLMPNPIYIYIYIYMVGFGWVLWYINFCCLFIVKSSLYMCIKYIGFGWVGFYGISTLAGCLMPNPIHTYYMSLVSA